MLIGFAQPKQEWARVFQHTTQLNKKDSDFYLFGGCLEHLFLFGSQTHLTPMIVERQSALLFSVLQSPGT